MSASSAQAQQSVELVFELECIGRVNSENLIFHENHFGVIDAIIARVVALAEGKIRGPFAKLTKSNGKKIVKLFNQQIKQLKRVNRRKILSSKEWSDQASSKIAEEIVKFAYTMSIPDPTKLNRYAPHSAETYGEVDLETLSLILSQIKLKNSDVFVDLGSGVGQVVTFTAAFAKIKKVSGIEFNEIPSKLAEEQGQSFQRLMKFFGKDHSPFELFKGDFLDAKFFEMITQATVIFMNNFAFPGELMLALEDLLYNGLPGLKIISSKKLSHGRKDSKRDKFTFDSISTTDKLQNIGGSVSWTGNKIDFFLTVLDGEKRDQLEKKKKEDELERRRKEEVAAAKKEERKKKLEERKRLEREKGKENEVRAKKNKK